MSSSAARAPSGDRYVTRRVRDKDGNIIVKRYMKSQSRLGIKIPWKKVPFYMIGVAFGLYAYLVNLHRTESFDTIFNEAGVEEMNAFFDGITGIASIFLTGVVAVGIATFLGWAIATKGFRLKQWPTAARQLLAIVAVFLLFSAVFSAFINEAGITRHQDEATNVDGNFDVSDLSAPFYSELLDGLLDLIGNIPNPEEIVANVYPDTGETFDSLEDTYLWRWIVAESYGTPQDPYDYVKGYEEVRASLNNANPATFDDILPNPDVKKFTVSQQYLSFSSGYSGDVVSTWNSLYDSQNDISNIVVNANNTEDEVTISNTQLVNSINSHPMIEGTFSDSGTSGYIDYDSYFIREDKELIAENAMNYVNFIDALNDGTIAGQLDPSRFGDLLTSGRTLQSIWGEASLPSWYFSPTDTTHGDGTAFFDKKDNYLSSAQNSGLSAYDVVLQISNEVQSAIIDMFNSDASDTLDLSDSAATENESTDEDRAYYFWKQTQNQDLFGVKDAIAGFVNLLRSLEIPARPVVGFLAGDVQPDQIQLTLGDLHVWVEAFIPWEANGTTYHSWGAFNPIPSYSYLLDNEFVYGQNSLGGLPEIEVVPTNGESQEIPSGGLGGETEMTLAQFGEPFEFGTRVIFDDLPSGGQTISLSLLNEQEALDLLNGVTPPTDIDSVGIDMGGVVTNSSDPEGWANVSISAEIGEEATFTNTFGQTINLNTTIETFDILGASGDRNIYAVVAKYGLAYSFMIVAWSLDAVITVDPSTEGGTPLSKFTVTDPGIFSTDTFDSMYSFVGENLTLGITVEEQPQYGGDPIVGQNVSLLFLSPGELATLADDAANNGEDFILEQYGTGAWGITDSLGQVELSYRINSSDVNLLTSEYYSFVAWLNPSYGELFVHISNEIDMTSEIQSDGSSNFAVFANETDTWDVSVTSLVSDAYLGALAGATLQRDANGATLDFMLVKQAFHDANVGDDAAILAALANCATLYNATGVDCYQLSDTNTTMGVISGNTTLNGNAQIRLVGSTVAYGVYYLYLYLPDQNLYFTNAINSQKIGFLSIDGQSSSPDKRFHLENPASNSEVNTSNNSRSLGSVPFLVIALIAIPISVKFTRQIKNSFTRRLNL